MRAWRDTYIARSQAASHSAGAATTSIQRPSSSDRVSAGWPPSPFSPLCGKGVSGSKAPLFTRPCGCQT